jgi:small subunit ribosomal protein S20
VAHSLSSKKRVRQNAKRNEINRTRKSAVKTEIKKFETVVKAGDSAKAQEALKEVARKLDKIASTTTMHKNTASRKKSRLAKRLNALKGKAVATA